MEKKPKVLIINCYADRHKETLGSPLFVPQCSAHVALAGALNPLNTDVKVYSEFYSGPMRDYDLFNWADMLVLTGLNTAFDRMKHLTAYAKSIKPDITVVVGGSLARILPKLCSKYFDYVCSGDAEQLTEVIDDCFGEQYSKINPVPRFDLMEPSKLDIGYVESTRNCNFSCSFCSMSAENQPFVMLDESFIRNQLDNLGYKRCVIFVDQNFYGGNRQHFKARMKLIKEYYEKQKFEGWACLLTEDFFLKQENIDLARESGCIGFYSGVESFSEDQIKKFNKKQNLCSSQEILITSCLNAGMVFNYGIVYDPSERTIKELEDELNYIVSNKRITLPSFISIAIPIIGTPLFFQRLAENKLLPNMKLIDMDGRALCTKPIEDEQQVVEFIRKLDKNPLPKLKLITHAIGFYLKYRKVMSRWAMLSSLMNTISMGMPTIGTNNREKKLKKWQKGRVYHASYAPVGTLYTPEITIDDKYNDYFKPLYITDENGGLSDDLKEDFQKTSEIELNL